MTKYNFVLFCKSYIGDLERAKNLKKTIDKYNIECIPLYFVVPQSDIKIMSEQIITGEENYEVNFVSDETVLSLKKNNVQNWYTQQLIKLNFWKLNICNHYLCLDSDCLFIRNFFVRDFLYDQNTPYLPLTEPLKGIETAFMQLFRYGQCKSEEDIWNSISKNYLERDGKRFCLNVPPILSTEVLKNMENNYLKTKKMTFSDLIDINPYEYEWYCDYLLKYQPIKYVVCQTFFFSFYTETLYQIYRLLGFDLSILSQYYVGIILHEGYIKDKYYRPSLLGKIVRRFVILHYHQHKNRIENNISFRKKLKKFIKNYIKLPIKILILGK